MKIHSCWWDRGADSPGHSVPDAGTHCAPTNSLQERDLGVLNNLAKRDKTVTISPWVTTATVRLLLALAALHLREPPLHPRANQISHSRSPVSLFPQSRPLQSKLLRNRLLRDRLLRDEPLRRRLLFQPRSTTISLRRPRTRRLSRIQHPSKP